MPNSTGNSISVKQYLQDVLSSFNDINYLTFEDIQRLEYYKKELKEVKQSSKVNFNDEEKKLYDEILSFSPNWIGLSSIPPAIEDTDEIDVSTSIKYENKPKTDILVGRYKTIGGLSVDIGGAFFLTGLRNNNVYTEEITTDNGTELYARIEEENQTSLGFGINSEVSLRTGSLIRPTINIGSFIPFEEEISPFFGLGGGIGLYAKKVKISFAYGIAYGKVNSINEEYQNRDLSSIQNLTNETLTDKVWENSWYLSVGVRYVFNKKE